MKMRKPVLPLALLVVAAMAMGVVHADSLGTGGAAGSAGTAEDPVVTKSYVDEQIRRILNGGTLPEQPNLSRTKHANPQETAGSAESVTVIKLEKGQILYGGAGAEFVVRTGQAVAYASGENGIADVTTGKDIPGNAPIELNHLLLFPREGRGIQADPNGTDDVYVLVKGKYLLVNADGTHAEP